jgi:hypothetical protein
LDFLNEGREGVLFCLDFREFGFEVSDLFFLIMETCIENKNKKDGMSVERRL